MLLELRADQGLLVESVYQDSLGQEERPGLRFVQSISVLISVELMFLHGLTCAQCCLL